MAQQKVVPIFLKEKVWQTGMSPIPFRVVRVRTQIIKNSAKADCYEFPSSASRFFNTHFGRRHIFFSRRIHIYGVLREHPPCLVEVREKVPVPACWPNLPSNFPVSIGILAPVTDVDIWASTRSSWTPPLLVWL